MRVEDTLSCMVAIEMVVPTFTIPHTGGSTMSYHGGWSCSNHISLGADLCVKPQKTRGVAGHSHRVLEKLKGQSDLDDHP